MKTECGVLCKISKQNISSKDFIESLEKIQHRGQDACGIAFYKNKKIECIKSKGKVQPVFENYSTIYSKCFIGHTRYTTSGNNTKASEGIQPIEVSDTCYFVFNGNILSEDEIKTILEDKKTTSLDTYKISGFLKYNNFDALDYKNAVRILMEFFQMWKRAYNIIIICNDYVYILRDMYGTRPISYVKETNQITISSETVSFKRGLKDINYINIKPGELVTIHIKSLTIKNYQSKDLQFKAHCLFEYLYFMNKKSFDVDKGGNFPVENYRNELGKQLALQEIEYESKYNIDTTTMFDKNIEKIVIGIPETGYESGFGYATGRRYPFTNKGIVKTANIRSFIGGNDKIRKSILEEKFTFNKEYIQNKIVFLVDDSIVRGHTMKFLVKKCFSLGAKEVHVRITSPPIKNPCLFGVDLKSKKEMIANKYKGFDGIQSFIGSTSLLYLKLEHIANIFPLQHYCTGCINKNYNETKYSHLDW